MRFRDISIKADQIAPVSPLSPSQQQTRRKSAVTKAWFVVSDSGESRIEEVGKYSIMRRTGLPARDLRILDPMLSYPSTVLGRERAIVVNLEDIKAIITATEVLVLSSKSPLVSALVEDLQYHVLNLHRTPRQGLSIPSTNSSMPSSRRRCHRRMLDAIGKIRKFHVLLLECCSAFLDGIKHLQCHRSAIE